VHAPFKGPRQSAATPWVVVGAIMVGTLLPGTTGRAQVITETFKNSTAPGWVFAGSGYTPTLTSGMAGADGNAAGDGWLRLTTPGTNQATSAYYDTAFTAANATIFAKFDYESYGGSGADGITFFLFDGSVPFSVGAHGGSLGYAQKTLAGGAVYDHAGMAGGYLGIALDEFGNFSSASEGRVGGLNGTTGLVPDAIAVRGPGSGYDGYAYLGGSGTLAQSIDSATRPVQTNTVQMLLSATNQLTVTLQQGGTSPQTVLYMDLSGYARPETLKFGFSSGTGASTNFHDVRNLNVSTLTANLWSGGGGDGLWATNNNWDPTIVPNVGADILFDNTHVTSAQTINVGANRTVRSLSFDTPYNYTLNNNTLVFDNQGVASFSGIAVSQTHGASTNTVNSALVMNNAIHIRNNSTGTLAINGTIDTNGHTLTLDGTGTATVIAGVVSDTGAVVKNDSGTVTLSAANTYSGGTTVNNGTLAIGHNTGFGTGTVTLAGGSIASTGTNTIANAVNLNASGGISGLTLSNTLTQTGSNTLTLANSTLGNVALGGGTLTTKVDSGTSAITGVIANGGLTKTGAGTLTLGGANTYTGDTTVTEGTVTLGAANRIADGSSLNLSGGTLNLNTHSEQVNNLTFSNGGGLDFGAQSGANYFLFTNISGTPSGVLTISNWQNGTDIIGSGSALSTTVLDQFYFVGYGAGATQTAAQAVGSYSGTWMPIVAPSSSSGWTTWDSGNSTDRWDRGANWNPNLSNGWTSTNTTKVAFGTGAQTTVDLRANRTINAMRFDAGSASFNIGNSQGDTLTFDGPNAGSIAFIQQASANNQSLTMGTVNLAKNTVVDMIGSGNLTISSVLTGSGNLVKENTGGTLILSGNSSAYAGNIYVNAGTLRITNANALGNTTGTTTIADGGTLAVSGTLTTAENITVAGAGVGGSGAIQGVSGTSTLSGTVTLAGATTVGATSGNTLALGTITGTNQNLATTGAGNVNLTGAITTGSGTLTVGTSGTTTMTGAANTYTGTTTVNAGTLVLNKAAGTTALAGNLTVNAGTVRLDASNQIANTATVTLLGSATLNLNGQTETLGQLNSASATTTTALGAGALTLNGPNNTNSNYAGNLTGTAGSSLTVTGTGKVYLSGNGSGYAGTTNVASGTLNVSGSNTVLGSGAVNVSTGGNLQLQGGISLANAATINGGGTSLNGAIENFAGNNTLTGAITLGSASRIQSAAGTLALGGNVTLGTHTLTMGGAGNLTQSGVISGTGGLTKDGAGTVTLSGANTYSGATTISAGTLRLGASERIGNLSAVSVATGATFDLNGQNETIGSLAGSGEVSLGASTLTAGGNDGSTLFAGTIDGAGTFTKAGAGTLTIGGDLAFDGTLNLAGGALQFDVDNAFTGPVTIGAGTVLRLSDAHLTMGTLNITGNSTIDFAGTASRLDVTTLNISAGVTLTIRNWQDATDYFFAQNWIGAVQDQSGVAPMNQIAFDTDGSGGTTYSPSVTKWQGYDDQITPVPEPSTYGALLMGAGLAAFGVRRWRRQRRAARA
jgi:fibronectin-binding autotransporter adhesin